MSGNESPTIEFVNDGFTGIALLLAFLAGAIIVAGVVYYIGSKDESAE